MTSDPRQHSPAAERNQGPLLQQLQRLLPARGQMLEIASGTGQHAAHFSRSLPHWQWQPSDPVQVSRSSVDAWCQDLPQVAPALHLDVLHRPWPVPTAHFDAVFCANMLHIAPWACCAALMQGARGCLTAGGLLLVYGPFIETDTATAPSNAAFDADLRQRNPGWGLRHLHEVLAQAQDSGLALQQRVVMPANNLLLVWRSPLAAG